MARRGKRRIWSDVEKRTICVQTRVAGVSVSQVARRYDVNANLVFSWLKDPRFAPGDRAEEASVFLPVEIIEERKGAAPVAPPFESCLEIDLAGGHRLRISGGYDPEALACLIRGLSA